jgi:hypothetical protein
LVPAVRLDNPKLMFWREFQQHEEEALQKSNERWFVSKSLTRAEMRFECGPRPWQRNLPCQDRDSAMRPALPTASVRVTRSIPMVVANRPDPVLYILEISASSIDIIEPYVISF